VPKPDDAAAVPPAPKPDDAAPPPAPKPDDAAAAPPASKPDDAAAPPPGQQPDDGVPPAGSKPDDHKPFTDQITQHIRDKLSEQPGVTPEILDKFDKISNLSVDQLKKVMPDGWAEKFEGAVKVMSDPWYGKSGLAGKTVVDLIKGVPASISNSSGDE
jgi:hypothetical protein